MHYLIISLDVVLCASLRLIYLATALQYYTGDDTSILRFMDSVAGQ